MLTVEPHAFVEQVAKGEQATIARLKRRAGRVGNGVGRVHVVALSLTAPHSHTQVNLRRHLRPGMAALLAVTLSACSGETPGANAVARTVPTASQAEVSRSTPLAGAEQAQAANGGAHNGGSALTDSGQTNAATPEAVARRVLGRMTLEQKVGQVFMLGFDGTSLTTANRALMQGLHLGGVTLFGRNIVNGPAAGAARRRPADHRRPGAAVYLHRPGRRAGGPRHRWRDDLPGQHGHRRDRRCDPGAQSRRRLQPASCWLWASTWTWRRLSTSTPIRSTRSSEFDRSAPTLARSSTWPARPSTRSSPPA